MTQQSAQPARTAASVASARTDPLDALFGPAASRAGTVELASALPVRDPGTRSRAGNSMSRTRAAVLAGAARAVSQSGTRITMSQVAVESGIAKATLYNHFRTRDAVLQALLADQVDSLIVAAADRSLESALHQAAVALAEHPVLRALADIEPASLAGLARIDTRGPLWQRVQQAVDALLLRSGRSGTTTVVRWLASYLVSPDEPEAILSDLRVLIAGLPAGSDGVDRVDHGGVDGGPVDGGPIDGSTVGSVALGAAAIAG